MGASVEKEEKLENDEVPDALTTIVPTMKESYINPRMKNLEERAKLIMIGELGMGKTSILGRLIRNEFTNDFFFRFVFCFTSIFCAVLSLSWYNLFGIDLVSSCIG